MYTIWPSVEFWIIQVPLVIGGSKTWWFFSQWCHSQLFLQYLKGQIVFFYHFYLQFKCSAMGHSHWAGAC